MFSTSFEAHDQALSFNKLTDLSSLNNWHSALGYYLPMFSMNEPHDDLAVLS
jgi:hypothetical protein